jgi:WD40 repeat protein
MLLLQGVNCIRWLPKWGHLLLSASLDNTVKIWDVYDSLQKNCHSCYSLLFCCYSHALVVLILALKFGLLWVIIQSGIPIVSVYAPTTVTHRCLLLNFHIVMRIRCTVSIQRSSARPASHYTIHFVGVFSKHFFQGVRSVTFNSDGTQFFSTSYDKLIRLWDTETGYSTHHVVSCSAL